MLTIPLSLAIVALSSLVLLYPLYVGLIRKKNRVSEALGNIDAQLQQRLDLLPNILKLARRFMDHESTLFEEITNLRTAVSQPYNKNHPTSVQAHLTTAQALTEKMGNLVVSVENYPALKSDQTMVQAMQTYNEVEGRLSASRRFYNSAVTELNNAVQIFPSSVVAKWLRIEQMPFFEADPSAKNAIDADQFLR
jgi:LemA protein